MKNARSSLFIALGLAGISSAASANSFNINEHDASATGRGGAVAASDDDASAIVFNPGGLGLVTGTQISVEGTLYIAQGSYENPTTAQVTTNSPPQPVPSFFMASRVTDMLVVGVGVHLPFGLAVSYPADNPQATTTESSDLRTVFISPTVGLDLRKQVPGLTVGAGIDIVPSSVELKRAVAFGDTQGTVDLAATAVGVGWRAGVMYHPPAVPGLKLGLMYRAQVGLDFKGKANFDIADPYRAQLPPDGDASTTINLPRSFWGGAAYDVNNLEIEVDAVWMNWANTFAKDPARGPDATSLTLALPGNQTSYVPEDYTNTVTYRVGLDYRLPTTGAHVRAGLLYDPTPIPITTQTAQLPDVNRIAVTLGASYPMTDKVGLSLSALWIPSESRDSSSDPADPIFHGTYTVTALVLCAGLSGRFGASPEPSASGRASVAQK